MIVKSYPSLSFKEANIMCFRKLLKISGRSRRSEFWNFFLFNSILLIIGIPIIVLYCKKMNKITTIIFVLYDILFTFSSIALITVRIRRLHDIGKSGWHLLLELVPIWGGSIVLKYLLQDSDKRKNKYGNSPKYYEEYDNSFIGQENMLQPIEPVIYPNPNQNWQLNASQMMQIPQGMPIFIPFGLFNNFRINLPRGPPLVPNQNYEPGVYQGNI